MKNILWDNLLTQLVACLLMVLVMFYIAEVDIEFYRWMMMALGGWQLGSWVSSFARKHWPLYN